MTVSIGARWWKFDIHTHTPASADYGKSEKATHQNLTPHEWLKDFIDEGVECVAITDHNTGNWIDKVKAAASQFRAQGYNIHVFPGVEITANSNIHIIGIFDPEKSSAEIAAVVGACGFKGTHGDSNAVSEESAEVVAKKIKDHGGVAIPAHIDLAAGICQLKSHHTISQIIAESDAVEIIYPENEVLNKFHSLKSDLPSLLGSDSHKRIHVGRAFTWIKMATPSIEGLKLALVDGHSSTIRSDQISESPNKHSNLILHSITIEKTKYAGRGSPLTVKLNPWLNSIIGGRGSGKSSLVEFIRIAMNRQEDILSLDRSNEIRASFESFITTSTGRDTEGVMLDDAKISCVYQKDDTNYKITWDNANNEYQIYSFLNDEWQREDGDVRSRFPIKIFSQKQIFNLAKNPDSLLKLIDESEIVNKQEWTSKWSSNKFDFIQLCAARDELQRKISQKTTLSGELTDTINKIAAIEKSGHKNILNKHQSLTTKKNYIDAIKNKIAEIPAHISEIKPNLSIPHYNKEILDESNTEEKEIADKINNLINYTNGWISGLESALESFNETLHEFETELSNSDFQKNVESAKFDYEQLARQLSNQGINPISDYDNLIRRRAEIQIRLKEIEDNEKTLNLTQLRLNEKYGDLIRLRKELTERRTKFIKENLSENTSIKIEVDPLCNDDLAHTSFRKILGREDAAFSADIYDPDRDSGFILDAIKVINQTKDEDIENLINQRLNIVHRLKTEIHNFKSGEIFSTKLGKRFIDFLSQMPSSKLDELNTWFPADKIKIQFQDDGRFKDVSQGSAGQKASTVLSFLLSYGSEPLILDQPEDDLDNKLITSLVVSNLKQNKPRRQILVVTHNPNIVVNGDSEYVVALQSRGQITVLSSGALQEQSVRESVCEIMEGGEIALKQRYKRMIRR